MAPGRAHDNQITMYLQSFPEMFLFWLKNKVYLTLPTKYKSHPALQQAGTKASVYLSPNYFLKAASA